MGNTETYSGAIVGPPCPFCGESLQVMIFNTYNGNRLELNHVCQVTIYASKDNCSMQEFVQNHLLPNLTRKGGLPYAS